MRCITTMKSEDPSSSPARDLVLASASPRRRALLHAAGFDFEVKPVEVKELEPGDQLDPWIAVRENALRKITAARRDESEDTLVLAADTILVLEGRWVGKPGTRKEAAALLAAMGGKAHKVVTAVSLLGRKMSEDFTEATTVHVKSLSPGEIQAYHAAVDPLDKAGGYDIDEHGPLSGGVIASITGSYSNVMGLPMERLTPILQRCLS